MEVSKETPITTLAALFTQYCSEKVLRPASIECYKHAVRSFEMRVAEVEKIAIWEITKEHLIEFRNRLLDEELSGVSWNTYRAWLSTLFKFAVSRKYMQSNPVQDVGKAAIPKGRFKTFSFDDVRLLFDAIKKIRDESPHDEERSRYSYFWEVVAMTLYYTGMRRRQLTGLRWDDLDFGQQTILLRSETSKNHNEWKIPIHTELLEVLKDFKLRVKGVAEKRRQNLANSKVFDPANCGLGFTLTPPRVTEFFGVMSGKIGIRITAHSFRHSLATNMANGQVNLVTVKEFLGHSSISTTCQYIRPDVQAMRDAMCVIRPL